MKKAFFLTLAITLLFSISIDAQTAKVIKIKDGNTISLLDKNNRKFTLTLAEVICPDVNKSFGKKSKNFTENQVKGKVVEYNIIHVDNENRNIAMIFYDGKYLSEEIIKNGFGWHFKEASIYNFKILNDLENYAKINKIGIWNESTIIVPWEINAKGIKSRSQLSEGTDPRR